MQTDLGIAGFLVKNLAMAGKRLGLNSERGNLYKSIRNVIQQIKPKLLLVENVKRLLTIDMG